MALRILIADDAVTARRRITEALAKAGHEIVAESSSGTEAVEKFKETKPDVSLIDFIMPAKCGVEVISEIRGIDSEAVILAAVPQGDKAAALAAVDAGASAILEKPCVDETLLAAVAEAGKWMKKCREGT